MVHTKVHLHHLPQHSGRWQIKAAFATEILMVPRVKTRYVHGGMYERGPSWPYSTGSVHSVDTRSWQDGRWAQVLLPKRLMPCCIIVRLRQRRKESVPRKGENVVQIRQMAEVAASRRRVHQGVLVPCETCTCISGPKLSSVWRGRALRVILYARSVRRSILRAALALSSWR